MHMGQAISLYKPFLLIFLASVLIPVHADSDDRKLPSECQTRCVSPYGSTLGLSGRVEAFSNCRSSCVIFEPNEWEGTYTGIKWQCVEYARRWLLINKGVIYGDVDVAADIWDKIDDMTQVATGNKIPLESHLNGSKQPPQIGDLLIYARAFNGTGHVAVVTDVDHEKGMIKVGEQNYDNVPWQGDHARTIELIHKNGYYWLLDRYLLGWKHVRS